MIRTACLLIALSAFSMVASAQDDPLAWFPLQVGSHWVYEHEWKSGDRNRPDVDRWTTEETITGRVTIPEGVVVLREVKNLYALIDRPHAAIGLTGNSAEPGFLERRLRAASAR